MLTRIDLQHFKCFESLKLPLRPLTLLSGVNASGKSSVLHALVLLHQTMREHEWSMRLLLNGSVVRLGTVGDVIDKVHGRQSCTIALLDSDTARFQWEFEGERDEMSMELRRFSGPTNEMALSIEIDRTQPFRHLLPHGVPTQSSDKPPSVLLADSLAKRMCGLTYLTAERLGPREYYLFDDPQLTPVVGPRGEYAISILHSRRDTHVVDSLVVQDVPPTLFRQVEARMARFFPDCVLETNQVRHANAVTLGIRMSTDTDFHRPIHTGFGLTQVLPIVVAALVANKEDLLLIENPEVHMHPAGQAMMGEFLAQVAAAGVQVMIETHSDHVLNGIRRAIKNRTLPANNVALHFFQMRREDQPNGTPQVQSPILDAHGNIDSWPDGFFDQFDKDMNYFAGWS